MLSRVALTGTIVRLGEALPVVFFSSAVDFIFAGGAACRGSASGEFILPAVPDAARTAVVDRRQLTVFSAVSAHSAPPDQIGVFTPHTGCPFLGTRPILLINHKNATIANPHAKRLSSVGASMLATCSGSPPNESGAVVAATTPLADHHHSPASLLHVVIP